MQDVTPQRGVSGPERLVYGPDPSQFVEQWRPSGQARGTAILLHGGYWRDRWALDLMDPMAAHLVAGGWLVNNIEYRRVPSSDEQQQESGPQAAPGQSGPAGVWHDMAADVLAAITLGIETAANPGAAATKNPGGDGPTVIIGHSAGGQLALWAASKLARSNSGVGPALTVALAPVADLIEADRLGLSTGAAALLLGGGADKLPNRYREASPVELLPIGTAQLIIHGRGDTDVPQDLSLDYTTRATAAGDQVELINTTCVDHFDIINPNHWIWRAIDRRLALVSGHGDL